jgi:hypothetical protein
MLRRDTAVDAGETGRSEGEIGKGLAKRDLASHAENFSLV